MDKKKYISIIIGLFLLSAGIYALQIILFHDIRTTEFYILQDLAFMPITIAIATLVVGELVSSREKKDRMEKTRMLTSTFFSGLGISLSRTLLKCCDPKEPVRKILQMRCTNDADLKDTQNTIRMMDLSISLTKETYEEASRQIASSRTSLMVLSSNPMLFEHEEFTDLLWAVFHVNDEYQLRGSWDELSPEDIAHLNQDYTELYRLLLISYVANAKYLKDTYPNLYRTAKQKIKDAI